MSNETDLLREWVAAAKRMDAVRLTSMTKTEYFNRTLAYLYRTEPTAPRWGQSPARSDQEKEQA